MALTIDKQHTAVLAMDMQNDIIHENGAFKDAGFAQMVKQGDIIGKTSRLLGTARQAGLKVIYVTVQFRPGYPDVPRYAPIFQGAKQAGALQEGTWGAAIHDGLKPQSGEPVVTKRGISAFTGSDLVPILTTGGIHTLLLAGVATNFVVEGTAREAADRGYNVVVVGDCCASMSQEAHQSSLNTALPMLATVATSDEVLAALR